MNKEMNNTLIIFEFFSGIGGMHKTIKAFYFVTVNKKFPFDIANPNANLTYFYNFIIKPSQLSIENLILN